MKRTFEKLNEDYPEACELLRKEGRVREKIGRPQLEDDQPDLIKTIMDIAALGASADGRRRTDVVNSARTLDDLHDVLQDLGYKLCRSACYLRLQPRRGDTREGKRHLHSVPVKLCRAQNNQHRQHQDAYFAAATINNMRTLASFMGDESVFFLSMDDKARVPIGITAASKQVSYSIYFVSVSNHLK